MPSVKKRYVFDAIPQQNGPLFEPQSKRILSATVKLVAHLLAFLQETLIFDPILAAGYGYICGKSLKSLGSLLPLQSCCSLNSVSLSSSSANR